MKATTTAIGEYLRRARLTQRKTLAELATEVGCAPSHLSALENGKKGAPTDELAVKLEQALSLQPRSLITQARWERGMSAGGDEVQRKVTELTAVQEAARRLAGMLKRSDSVLGALNLDALYSTGELRRLVETISPSGGGGGGMGRGERPGIAGFGVVGGRAPLREIPVINKVAAGYPRGFTDLEYPARVADEYVRCPDISDPDAFAARVVGDSMSPVYVEGDIVVFSPAKQVKNGSDCFARLEPDQEMTFKRVYFEGGGGEPELIRLQPVNNAYAARVVGREQVAGLYAAAAMIRRVV